MKQIQSHPRLSVTLAFLTLLDGIADAVSFTLLPPDFSMNGAS